MLNEHVLLILSWGVCVLNEHVLGGGGGKLLSLSRGGAEVSVPWGDY